MRVLHLILLHNQFTPRKRFDEESPWIGGGRLSQLSTSSFTLVNAHANDERRLGAREDTKVEDLLQNVVAETYPHAFTDWNEMKQSISESRVIGLRQMSPLDDLVLLQPSKWEKPEFDEIEQQLVIRLHDGNGEVIHLMLPFSPDTAATIRQLEKAKFQNKRTRLLAYRRHQPFPHVFPVALIHEEKGQWSFDHLLMAKPLENKTGLIKKLLHGRLPASFQPLKADLGEAMVPELTPTGQFLSPLDDLLMQLAGSGVHRRVEEAGWNAIIRQLESSGMSQLAMSAKQLASTDSPHPRELLICRYLHLLHLEAG